MTAYQIASKINLLPLTLKKEAEKYIESLLLKANIDNHKIKKTPVLGCAKGEFRLSEDFNDPIEYFKDYM